MIDPESAAENTSLTERQAEVLALRRDGMTQAAIAERLGTTVANISAIERAGRENVERARQTLGLVYRLDAADWFTVRASAHLRDVVEAVYDHGDSVGVKITYSHPELMAYLQVQFQGRLDGRRLTEAVELGITPDGGVVAEPPVVRRG